MNMSIQSMSTSPSRTDSGMSKRPSKKWTEQEMQRLVGAIAMQSRGDRINWADVAKVLPGRTGRDANTGSQSSRNVLVNGMHLC